MASQYPQYLKNMNLYVDGKGFAGLVDEIVLPTIAITTEDYRAGGMDTSIEIDLGIEKLESSFSINKYDPDVFAHFGLTNSNQVNITMRGAFDQDGAKVPIIVKFRGSIKSIEQGTWTVGEKTGLKFHISPRFYSLDVNNFNVFTIDTLNMKRIINGVDQLAQERAILGI